VIKFKPISEDTVRLLPKAQEYLQSRPDIFFAYLFGSLAQKKPKPLSDVDLAVFMKDSTHQSDRKLEILGHLVELLKTDEVDLVILNTAPLSLKMRILKNRKVIADNVPSERHKFESLTMRQSFDFAVKEKGILERRFLRG